MPGPKAPEEARREQIVSAAYHVALRNGIDGLTLRAVAAQAKLSHGLVIFYFKQKDQLIAALLDRVLATTAMLHVAEDVAEIEHPPERLGALLQQELDRLSRDPRGIRLFFEYWALGVRQAAIRKRIAAALERYRAAFSAMAEEVLAADASRDTDVTPDALAAVAISLITGYVVQGMIDPDHFDSGGYVIAVQALMERLVPAAA
jgi:TetR/AcrR family transcriptional regulator, transcriptional repressor of bet genes